MSGLRLNPAALLLLALCGWAAAPAGGGPGPALGVVTRLPVPRFVSLRTGEVNFRAGPGFQYPILWTYQRAGLPVEIIGEFDVWRQLRAPDGGTGWVHEETLRARRGFIVTADRAALRAGPDGADQILAYLGGGVSGSLLSCAADAGFCKVDTGAVSGYLARGDFWGAFPDELVK